MIKVLRLTYLLLLLATLAPTAARALTAELPLTRFLPYPSLELRCVSDEHAIEVPIPLRWKVNSATLNLHYTVSNAVITRLSHLAVKLNGTSIGQTKLVSLSGEDPYHLKLPTSLLKHGYNKLAFFVSQHYTEKECALPCSSALWTSVKLDTSSITIDYDLKPVPPQMASVAEYVFDPRILTGGSVHLAFDTTSEEAATMAAIVASGVARRFDYRRVSFSVSDTLRPGRDNVVIGNATFLQKVLGAAAPPVPAEKGGFLKIMPMPSESAGKTDDLHAMVVVAGATLEEQKLAAMTLASVSIPYPGSDEVRAVGFSVPDIAAYSGRRIISSDKLYEFRTLNTPTHTMAGMNPQPINIDFRLPADFLIKQNRSAELVLNFSYGAGLRPDSALNLLVNGKAVRVIPLQNSEGGFFEKYKMEIPTYVFQPGDNRITFSPELHTQGKECEIIQPGNLFFTLFDNSTIKFPYMPHFVDMPRLELFMLNGFPFTRWPDGFNGILYLARPSVDSLAAAMNIVGMMTQKNGFPLLNLALTYKSPQDWTGDMIVMGDVFSLPPDIAAAAPFRVGKTSTIPYPIVRNWQNEGTNAFSEQVSRMGSDKGLLMQFQSPRQVGRSVLLLAAEGQGDLLRLSEILLEPEVQSQVFGDLVLLDFAGPKPSVTSMNVGPRYSTGKQGKISWYNSLFDKIDALMYAHRAVFFAILGAVLAGLSWVLVRWLRRYRARRLAAAQGAGK